MIRFTELSISPERTAAFESQLQQTINQGSLSLMISLGYQTGLWNVLSQLDHATSQEISNQAGLKEQYVADWLATMLSGGIIDYDPIFQTYRLPKEHAQILTDSDESQQYADSLQWLSLFGKLDADLVRCFREEAKPSSDTTVAALLAEQQQTLRESLTKDLFGHIFPLVPGLIMRLCDGLDVLDLECGNGVLLLELARAFPQSQFVGYDSSAEQIAQARESAAQREIENVTFLERKPLRLQAINAFDLIMAFDLPGEQQAPSELLEEIHTALRPGGNLLIRNLAQSRSRELNLQHPLATLLYAICCVRDLAVSTTHETEWICQKIEAAGFSILESHRPPHDLLHEYHVVQKAETAARALTAGTAS